jgi:hypothetical protein
MTKAKNWNARGTKNARFSNPLLTPWQLSKKILNWL